MKYLILILIVAFTIQAHSKDDPVYLILAYSQDEQGNYAGHTKFNMHKSDWKKSGKDKAKWLIQENLGTKYKSSTAIHPGECYVLYTTHSPGSKIRIHRAASYNQPEKFEFNKKQVKRWVEKFPRDNYRYVEDGCNINLSVKKVKQDKPQEFDSFSESFQGLTLEQGTFQCLHDDKQIFKVERIRPGVYYFSKENNELNIPIDFRKALSPNANENDVKKVRNQYHSMMSKMCKRHVTPKVDESEAIYNVLRGLLRKSLEKCNQQKQPQEVCDKIKKRIAATGSKARG